MRSWQNVGTTGAPSTKPTPSGPMTAPVAFETKFATQHCHGCRGIISRGAMVNGIKQTNGKWIIWHQKPECLNAVIRRGLMPGMLPPSPAPRADVPHRAKEQEWMELYEAELKTQS